MSFGRHFMMMGLLCVVLTVLIDPVWGSYEGFFAMLISGNINDAPLTRAYIYGAEPLARVAASLHGVNRAFPWVGLAIGLNYLISMTLISRLFDRLLQAQGRDSAVPKRILLVAAFVASAFVLPEYSYSSVGFLTASVAVLSIWQLCFGSDRGFGFWCRITLLTIFFLNAFAFRIDSAMGGTFIALLVVAASGKGIWRTALVLMLPGVLSLSMVMWVYWSFTELEFLNRVEPYVYYVTDSRHQPDVEMNTATDSIMVKAAQQSFVNDTSVLNVAFFERLAKQKNEAIGRAESTVAVFMKAAGNTVIPAVRANSAISVVYLLMVLLSILVYHAEGGLWAIVRPLLFHVTVAVTVLLLGGLLKMETWHYVPIIQVSILGSIALMALRWKNHEQWHKHTLDMLFVICLVIIFFHLAVESAENRKVAAYRKETLERVQLHRGEKLLYLDGSSREILNLHVYRPYIPLHGVLLYDQGQLAMMPEPKAVLDNLCRCNSGDFPTFMDFLIISGEHVVILSSEQRLHLISEYARIIYSKDVRFLPCGNFNSFETPLSDISCYHAISNDH